MIIGGYCFKTETRCKNPYLIYFASNSPFHLWISWFIIFWTGLRKDKNIYIKNNINDNVVGSKMAGEI